MSGSILRDGYNQLNAIYNFIANTTKKFGYDFDFDCEVEVEVENSEMSFEEILEYLETLPAKKEKIHYLIDIITKFKQSSNPVKERIKPTLAEKCEYEIEKLKRIEGLEEMSENISENGLEELSAVKRIHKGKELKAHKDLSTDRAILFMNYLFKKAGASIISNTAKAEAIFFLTGFDKEAIRQRLSSIHFDKTKQDDKHSKDLRIVRNLFDRLGLHEIVNEINSELNPLE